MTLKGIGVIALLLYLLPFIIGGAIRIFDSLIEKTKAGRIKAIWALVFLFLAGIILFYLFPILLYLLPKWVPGVAVIFIIVLPLVILVVSAILVVIENLKRKIWKCRIDKKLNGQLGQKLKNILPKNAMYYIVGENGIKFDLYNKAKIIVFCDLGYQDIPAEYANIVCMWIRDNLTVNKAYQINKCIKYKDEYVPGTPDTYRIEKKYDQYEVTKTGGSSSYYTKREVLVGYKLEAQELINQGKAPKLSKW